MACFFVVATRRAVVRNSLRSWLKPELPFPLVGAEGEEDRSALGLGDPFPPETLDPFPGGGVSPGKFDGALSGAVCVGEAASVGSVAEEPFSDGG
jgi:hypothetical protein